MKAFGILLIVIAAALLINGLVVLQSYEHQADQYRWDHSSSPPEMEDLFAYLASITAGVGFLATGVGMCFFSDLYRRMGMDRCPSCRKLTDPEEFYDVGDQKMCPKCRGKLLTETASKIPACELAEPVKTKPLESECPHCQKAFSVKPASLNRQAICPGCKKKFTVKTRQSD